MCTYQVVPLFTNSVDKSLSNQQSLTHVGTATTLKNRNSE